MHSNGTIKNVSWRHFSWATLYCIYSFELDISFVLTQQRCEFFVLNLSNYATQITVFCTFYYVFRRPADM